MEREIEAGLARSSLLSPWWCRTHVRAHAATVLETSLASGPLGLSTSYTGPFDGVLKSDDISTRVLGPNEHIPVGIRREARCGADLHASALKHDICPVSLR